jgi:hypothetical protein
MKYDPRSHQRRLFRLKGYDYSLPGAYFVTVCTYQRECLLGEIHQVDKGDKGESETRPYKTRPYQPTAFDSTPPPQKRHGLPEIVRALKS